MCDPRNPKKHGAFRRAQEEVAFLNVHTSDTTGKKRGGGVVTHLASSLKYHCLLLVHTPILLHPFYFF